MHARRGSRFDRFDADRQRYGAIAHQVMSDHKVPVVQLGRFTAKLGLGPEVFSDGVHFLPHVQQHQAAYIAGYLQSV